MKRNHSVITCFTLLSILFLAISVLLEWRIDCIFNISWPSTMTGHRSFFENIFIGLFASGILVVFVALLDYFKEKTLLLQQLPRCVAEVSIQLNVVGYLIRACAKKQSIDYNELIDYLAELSRVTTICYGYTNSICLFSKALQSEYSLLSQRLNILSYHTVALQKTVAAVKYNEELENMSAVLMFMNDWTNYLNNCGTQEKPIGLIEYLQNFTPEITAELKKREQRRLGNDKT